MVTPYVIVLRLVILLESGLSLYSRVTYNALADSGLGAERAFVRSDRGQTRFFVITILTING